MGLRSSDESGALAGTDLGDALREAELRGARKGAVRALDIKHPSWRHSVADPEEYLDQVVREALKAKEKRG